MAGLLGHHKRGEPAVYIVKPNVKVATYEELKQKIKKLEQKIKKLKQKTLKNH